MATQTPARLITAEELIERSSDFPRWCELIRGEIVEMPPPKPRHGEIVARLSSYLRAFVVPRKLGRVTAESGWILERGPDTVRAPDVAFTSAKDVPEGYFEGAPDLAVEVLSPDDRAGDIAVKIELLLTAGARMVWVVQPSTRTVIIHRDLSTSHTLRVGDSLDGGEVLPGFTLPVEKVFED